MRLGRERVMQPFCAKPIGGGCQVLRPLAGTHDSRLQDLAAAEIPGLEQGKTKGVSP